MGNKFKFGLILGAIAGVVGGLFLSENPGKQLRKKTTQEYELLKKKFEKKTFDEAIQEIFGEVSGETKKIVRVTQQQVVNKIVDLRETAKSLDKEKYGAIVQEVVDELRSTSTVQPSTAKKIQAYLLSDFKKLTKFPKKEAVSKSKSAKKKPTTTKKLLN